MAEQTPTEGWQLEEGSATAYERYLVPVFMNPWADDLVATVELKPDEQVLDVACGTGIVARHAARRGAAVTGVDSNPSMLAVASEQAAGLEPPVRFEQAPADRLPFAEASFDVLLCQQGLQFFPDRAAALAEMRRVTKPSGRIGLSVCRSVDHQPGYAVLTDVLTRHLGVETGEVIRSPYALGDPEEVRALVAGAGLRSIHLRMAVWAARFPSARGFLLAETASSPLGERVARLDEDVQNGLLDDLAAGLRPYTDDDGVVFPFQTLVVTASR